MIINTYDELKNLTIEQLEENKAEKGTFKNYTYYVLNDCGEYGTCLFIVGNNNIIYIDEQIQYSTVNSQRELVAKMLEFMKQKIFNLNEFNVVTGYRDYRNKIDFLNNTYQKLYNAVSIYANNKELTAEQQELKEKGVLATKISFCYYKNEEELTQLYTLLDNLKKALLECLKDEQQREKAILYELNNHECFYTYDIRDVLFLTEYGITKQEITKVFNEYKNKYDY